MLTHLQLVRLRQWLPPSLNPRDTWMEETRKAQMELFGVRPCTGWGMVEQVSECVLEMVVGELGGRLPLPYADMHRNFLQMLRHILRPRRRHFLGCVRL